MGAASQPPGSTFVHINSFPWYTCLIYSTSAWKDRFSKQFSFYTKLDKVCKFYPRTYQSSPCMQQFGNSEQLSTIICKSIQKYRLCTKTYNTHSIICRTIKTCTTICKLYATMYNICKSMQTCARTYKIIESKYNQIQNLWILYKTYKREEVFLKIIQHRFNIWSIDSIIYTNMQSLFDNIQFFTNLYTQICNSIQTHTHSIQ